MDGVPGASGPSFNPGGAFDYGFIVPDPGTYWYHPHVGTQLDRGLYGVLLVDDPHDAGDYDVEWTVVLDDWVDGTGRDPDQVLSSLVAAGTSGMPGMDHGQGMSGMDHGGMQGAQGVGSGLVGGDVDHPYYLANGRIPAAPRTFAARPGQRLRLRLVNAAADTAFRVALGGHRFTVTHTDGFPVDPVIGDALLIGMGERYDVLVTLGDGVFPLVALPEGKKGQALALVRTGSGRAPAATARPAYLRGRLLTVTDLSAASSVALRSRRADRTHTLRLGGSMRPYVWTINGRTFDHENPLPVVQGNRVLLRFVNETMMFHPMHLHGHTFQVSPRDRGPRKDTVIVKPMHAVEVAFDAVNPGQWMLHCHNAYHAERGMMTTLSYRE
jgi:multicopper oxidase